MAIWLVCCIQCRVTFKSGANQATLNQLLREVKALNSDFLAQHISSKAMGNKEANYYLFLMHVLKFLNVCILQVQCTDSTRASVSSSLYSVGERNHLLGCRGVGKSEYLWYVTLALQLLLMHV